MNGLIRFPKPADVDVAASLVVAVAFISAAFYGLVVGVGPIV